MADAKRDQNRVTTLLGVSSVDGITPVTLYADPTSHALLATGAVPGGGTVTSVSVTTANGVSGTVASATTTPAITLTLGAITPTSVNGNTITAGTGTLTLGTNTLTVAGVSSITGTNSGDNAANTSCLALDQTTPQSVINGRATFVQGLKLGTTPTVGAFAEGKVYYDATKKSMTIETDTDVTMNLGIQEFAYVYNPNAEIPQGKLIYPVSGSGDTPTVVLAQADAEPTSLILGVTSQVIGATSSGFILVRGVLKGTATLPIDTSAFTVGDTLYLSPTTPGGFTKVAPTTSQFLVRVGVCMTSHATLGSIYIRPVLKNRLADLADVSLSTPLTDQILRYNGAEWVNGAQSAVSGGPGVTLYFDGTEIIATGNNNDNHVETLASVPWAHAEDVEGTVTNDNTVLGDIYLYDTALSRTSIDAGTWNFIRYLGVSAGAGTTECLQNVYRVRPGTGTATTTDGADATHRVVTASSGTPFAAAVVDVGGTIDSDSFVQTPQGVYRITTLTDDTHVIILVPSTYSNESTVAYSVHKRLFQVTSGEVNNTASAPLYAGLQLYTTESVQPAYAIAITDKLAIYRFAKTTSSSDKTLYFSYGGTLRYSRVVTPLATLHGSLAGLQGGTGAVPAEEYYHLTAAQHTIATQAANTTVSGYLSTTDWDTFNDKQTALVNSAGLLAALSDETGTGLAVFNTSPTFVTPILGTPTSGTLTNCTIPATGITAGTIAGEINLGENFGLALDTLLSDDGKYSGVVENGLLGATIAFGDLCYLDPTDGRWELADANVITAADGDCRGMLGICVLAGNDGDGTKMLLWGKVRAAAFPAFTINAQLYVSETAGDITHTQPTTANVAIRVVGTALTVEDLFFNPSPDYITHS